LRTLRYKSKVSQNTQRTAKHIEKQQPPYVFALRTLRNPCAPCDTKVKYRKTHKEPLSTLRNNSRLMYSLCAPCVTLAHPAIQK
jgi:hypothetical protein